MIEVLRQAILQTEERDIMPYEAKLCYLFSPQGKYGVVDAKISKVNFSERFLHKIFNDFANEWFSRNYFSIAEISFFRTLKSKEFKARPGDVICCFDRNRFIPSLEKYRGRYCLTFNELVEKTGSFAINAERFESVEDLSALAKSTFIIIKKNEFTMRDIMSASIIKVGTVTDDMHLRFFYNSEIIANIPSACWQKLFEAKQEITVWGLQRFTEGFLKVIEASYKTRISPNHSFIFDTPMSVSDLLAFKLGVYYAEYIYVDSYQKNSIMFHYNQIRLPSNLDGYNMFFVAFDNPKPPYADVIAMMRRIISNDIEIAALYFVGEDGVGQIIDRVLGSDNILSYAADPLPQLAMGSIVIISAVKLNGFAHLGTITAKQQAIDLAEDA